MLLYTLVGHDVCKYQVDPRIFVGLKENEKMNTYRLDLSGYAGKEREAISEAVQKHAFSLGFSWCGGTRVMYLNKFCLVLCGWDHTICFCDNEKSLHDQHMFISVSDFLALKKEDVNDRSGKFFSDFSWVRGAARKVLMSNAIVCNFNAIVITDIDYDKPYMVWTADKSTVWTMSGVPGDAEEVRCNDLLEGKI